jgi:hypothetical protein
LQLFLYFLGGLIGLYLLLSLIFTYLVQQLPRKPITDPPDWGRIIDTKIPAIDGGMLEVWRIEVWLSWRTDGVAIGIVWFPEPGYLPSGALQRFCTAPGTTGGPAGAGL